MKSEGIKKREPEKKGGGGGGREKVGMRGSFF